MATASKIPLEVYLRSSEYEPDAEYVDGVIEERPVGELDHAAWQAALVMYFRQHGDEWKVKVYPELRVKVSPTRFRVPDVTVLDQAAPVEQIITHAPLMVFEILSPEDTVTRMLVKLADYATMGIAGIFVIDPATQAYYVFHDGALQIVSGRSTVGRCQIDFQEIQRLLE